MPTWIIDIKSIIEILSPIWICLIAVVWTPLKRYGQNLYGKYTEKNNTQDVAIEGLASKINNLTEMFEDERERSKKINLAVLHSEIYTKAKEAINKGKIKENELRNLSILYESYHALGGDGLIDKMMREVDNLDFEGGR